MSAPGHLTTVYAAEIVESDYPFDEPGKKVWLATCSCGWHIVRQFEHATRNQLGKHLARVAA